MWSTIPPANFMQLYSQSYSNYRMWTCIVPVNFCIEEFEMVLTMC
jgi:hypothetical protein